MIKLTVLYGHPQDAKKFETYYVETHMPLVATITGLEKVETTKFVATTDGSATAFYRMAELSFKDEASMQSAMGSAEGMATANDLANFATGGAEIMIGVVE